MKKVKYLGCTSDHQARGWCSNYTDPRGLLVEGQEYEVNTTDVGDWNSSYTLVGIKGKFNTVLFDKWWDEK